VESLSPHRVLSTADENQDGTVSEQEARKQQDFATMILENLRKAGVQNTKKAERLKFDRLDPYAGTWIQAAGEYTEKVNSDQLSVSSEQLSVSSDKSAVSSKKLEVDHSPLTTVVRRVAVSLGPEHGTVGPQQVKEAAKEAVQGVGFDLLIVCGFAFDPHVSEEAKRYGKLNVLTARMNPDLAMGDELLKKTGAGNLFMVFGEPDVEIRRVGGPQPGAAVPQVGGVSQPGAAVPQAKGKKLAAGAPAGAQQIQVVVKGVDVYDPTTGEIRSSSTDDIACWFIDTDYNGESFFVRHAYFTGAEEPYEKLKRALRAEIDEAAWAMLYSTESRPFDVPASGKIAVKVINHYGDEVLRVLPVT
jgi:adenine-specific DNA-methyltransferase